MSWPRLTTPMLPYSRAMIRAMVVLPVPGAPVKTMWWLALTVGQAGRLALGVEHLAAIRRRTAALTAARPTSASSSAEDRRGGLALRWRCAVGRAGCRRSRCRASGAVTPAVPIGRGRTVGGDGVAGVEWRCPGLDLLEQLDRGRLRGGDRVEVASAASAAGETVGVSYDLPMGFEECLDGPCRYTGRRHRPRARSRPHSTCRGSTVGCE